MDLNDVLNLDIKTLSNAQYEALKKHTIERLNEVINLLNEDKLQEIAYLLKFSRDGDGWGSENYFIDFSYNDTECMDLGEILLKMAKLKNLEIDLDKEESEENK